MVDPLSDPLDAVIKTAKDGSKIVDDMASTAWTGAKKMGGMVIEAYNNSSTQKEVTEAGKGLANSGVTTGGSDKTTARADQPGKEKGGVGGIGI